MPQRHFEFGRQELYDAVWSQPVSKLALAMGLTSYDITKAARAMGVPLPPVGYWSKVAHGKTSPRPPLAEGTFPASYRNVVQIPEASAALLDKVNRALEVTVLPSKPLPPMAAALAQCLPIVKRTASGLKTRVTDRRGWHTVSGAGRFELSVSPQSELRALLTLDRIVRHCLQSGLKVVSDADGRESAHFDIEGAKLTLRLVESSKQHERALTTDELERRKRNPLGYVYLPDRFTFESTGKLRLEAKIVGYSSSEFTLVDGASAPLAERIADVPERLMQAALYRKAQREEYEAAAKRSHERQRILADKAAVKRKQLARLEEFEKLAEQHERAARLRVFLAKLEELGVPVGEEGTQTRDWLRGAADWLDPLVKRHWPEVDDAEKI